MLLLLFPVQVMAQQARAGRRYLRAFVSGFFVAVPVTVTVLDRLACVARVEGASMQVSHDIASTNRSERVILAPPVFGDVPEADLFTLQTTDKELRGRSILTT